MVVMNTYEHTVTLKVKTEAFDQSDAEEMIRDAIGVGDGTGVEIVYCEVGDFRVS